MRVIILITLMPHRVIARCEAIAELCIAGYCLNRDLWDSRMAGILIYKTVSLRGASPGFVCWGRRGNRKEAWRVIV